MYAVSNRTKIYEVANTPPVWGRCQETTHFLQIKIGHT